MKAFTAYLSYGKLQLLHNRLQKLDLWGGEPFPVRTKTGFSVKVMRVGHLFHDK